MTRAEIMAALDGLLRDAAFIHDAASVRYDGMLESGHVREVIEENLAASRAHRFEPPRVFRRVKHSKDTHYDEETLHPDLSCRAA